VRDVCLACGRPIFTVNAGLSRGIITLAERWTHGSRRRDRNHMAIPKNYDYEIEAR
jgi:hypothetical protein